MVCCIVSNVIDWCIEMNVQTHSSKIFEDYKKTDTFLYLNILIPQLKPKMFTFFDILSLKTPVKC